VRQFVSLALKAPSNKPTNKKQIMRVKGLKKEEGKQSDVTRKCSFILINFSLEFLESLFASLKIVNECFFFVIYRLNFFSFFFFFRGLTIGTSNSRSAIAGMPTLYKLILFSSFLASILYGK